MKKNKEKEKYESPLTKKTTVSLENGICAASADVKTRGGRTHCRPYRGAVDPLTAASRDSQSLNNQFRKNYAASSVG